MCNTPHAPTLRIRAIFHLFLQSQNIPAELLHVAGQTLVCTSFSQFIIIILSAVKQLLL